MYYFFISKNDNRYFSRSLRLKLKGILRCFLASIKISNSTRLDKSTAKVSYNIPSCFSSYQGTRNQYWVLYNYIRAARQFNCDETITYTTHGDLTFLDNLEPLLERWQGPISVAVYAPGSDLEDTIDVILYLRSDSFSSFKTR